MHLRMVGNAAKKTAVNSRQVAGIHIRGPSQLQNRLLARHLENNLHPPVKVSSGVESVSWREVITLMDCLNFDRKSLEEHIRRSAPEGGGHGRQILFNLTPGTSVEQQALEAGFSGIFYTSDTLDSVTRGVQAVLAGDVWFSREVVSNCIVERSSKLRVISRNRVENLTPREIEVLSLLVRGASNHRIAETFCISPTTVKAHLYHIYRKIGVRNRFQVIAWATRNL